MFGQGRTPLPESLRGVYVADNKDLFSNASRREGTRRTVMQS
jgi:hypothetical protein